MEVAAEALSELKTCVGNNMNNRSDGACDIWISSMENFSNLKTKLDSLCDSVMNGWKQKREQQSKDGFESAESIDMG